MPSGCWRCGKRKSCGSLLEPLTAYSRGAAGIQSDSRGFMRLFGIGPTHRMSREGVTSSGRFNTKQQLDSWTELAAVAAAVPAAADSGKGGGRTHGRAHAWKAAAAQGTVATHRRRPGGEVARGAGLGRGSPSVIPASAGNRGFAVHCPLIARERQRMTTLRQSCCCC